MTLHRCHCLIFLYLPQCSIILFFSFKLTAISKSLFLVFILPNMSIAYYWATALPKLASHSILLASALSPPELLFSMAFLGSTSCFRLLNVSNVQGSNSSLLSFLLNSHSLGDIIHCQNFNDDLNGQICITSLDFSPELSALNIQLLTGYLISTKASYWKTKLEISPIKFINFLQNLVPPFTFL